MAKGLFTAPNAAKKDEYTEASRLPFLHGTENLYLQDSEITQQDLIDKINVQCKENNWDYARLSKESGVPLGTLLNIVHGNTKNPGIFTILKLCDAFDMTLADFIEMQEG